MPSFMRVALSTILMIGLGGLAGCCCYPDPCIRQAQLQARAQWQNNQALHAQADQLRQQTAQLSAELQTANQRLANLNHERDEIHDRYVSLLNQAKNPLGNDLTRKFEELARQYPEFDFDPETGVSKFHSDILFDTGSAELKSSATKVLNEFARLMNDPEASRFHILVVGHTDDQPIAKSKTRNTHPTNWHLSTNRADAVVLKLAHAGIKESRMGAAGYSMFQPVELNMNESSRQRNRRVEIFILAPEASVAGGWDPETSLN